MAFTRRQKHRLLILIALVVLSYAASHYQPVSEKSADPTLQSLYDEQRSDVQIEIEGKVARMLPDDTKGSQHQRFIVELTSGNTVLVAHNIDLAPRIDNLNIGDEVTIYGEYVWNNKGGIMHWTHHDPANKHPHGWIRHQGKLYQ